MIAAIRTKETPSGQSEKKALNSGWLTFSVRTRAAAAPTRENQPITKVRERSPFDIFSRSHVALSDTPCERRLSRLSCRTSSAKPREATMDPEDS